VQGGESGREELREKKNQSRKLAALEAMVDRPEPDPAAEAKKKNPTKMERLLKRKAREELGLAHKDEDDEGGLVMKPSSAHAPSAVAAAAAVLNFSKRPVTDIEEPKPKKKRPTKISDSGVAKGSIRPTRTVFDDEGAPVDPFAAMASRDARKQELAQEADSFVERAAKRLREQDAIDKAEERKKIKDRKREKKLKANGMDEKRGGGVRVELGGSDGNEDDGDDGGSIGYDRVTKPLDKEALALQLIERF